MAFVRQLRGYSSLAALQQKHEILPGEGINWGSEDKKKPHKWLRGRHILQSDEPFEKSLLTLDAESLPINDEIRAERPRTPALYQLPQIVVKSSWTKETQRFRALQVVSRAGREGILCTQSYVSVSGKGVQPSVLESAALVFNSKLAVYYLLLTSGRFAFYRIEPLFADLMLTPLPLPREGLLSGVSTLDQVDQRVREAFQLEDIEWALIEDLCEYTLPDYRGDTFSPGYQQTSRKLNSVSSRARSGMAEYSRFVIEVLRAGFGEDKAVCATVYDEADGEPLPVRLVAIHLDWPGQELVRPETLSSSDLCNELKNIAESLRTSGKVSGGQYLGRSARVYSFIKDGGRRIPTVFLVKPDRRRYWTRSMALRDADAIAADIMTWCAGSEGWRTKDGRA
jgi:hypothetical protein